MGRQLGSSVLDLLKYTHNLLCLLDWINSLAFILLKTSVFIIIQLFFVILEDAHHQFQLNLLLLVKHSLNNLQIVCVELFSIYEYCLNKYWKSHLDNFTIITD